MPAVSKKQFRKMEELHKQGKISTKTLHEFTHGVDFHSLPDRAPGTDKTKTNATPGRATVEKKARGSHKKHKAWGEY